MSSWDIDRSRVLDFQACPRRRYYGHHFNGQGIQPKRKALPLVFGSAFHNAAEVFLTGGDVDEAVAKAHLFLDLTFSMEGVDWNEEKQTVYGVAEQKAIVEGLIRGWCISQRDQFLETFEVLEVEKEGRADLGQDVTLMFRPDALVREKATGDIYVVSWKTASTFGKWTVDSANIDMQSLSEVWGTKQTLRICCDCGKSVTEDADCPCEGAISIGSLSLEGTLYLFAVKGQRRMDDFLGFKTQRTPLVYGWKKLESDEFGIHDWSHSFNYVDDEGKNRRLGKGWKLVPIWEEYPGGVKQWIADLAANKITPRNVNVFDNVFPQMMPVSRRADEIESWKRQVVSQEGRVRQRVRAIEADPTDEVLDREMPQHTARCYDYQHPCSFLPICTRPAVKADPLGSGLFEIRTPNHPSEKGDVE